MILSSAVLLGGVSTIVKAAETPASIQPDSAELTAFKKAIREKYDMKEKAFAAHDAETIVTRFYTPDAISVGEGFGIFIGRDQLRPLFAKAVNQYTVKVTSVHTKVRGNAGWDWVDFAVTPVDSQGKPFTLAMLFLWVNLGGKWMCQGDFYVDGSFATGKLTAPSK
jgi:ketosteroid isomerase-like protein